MKLPAPLTARRRPRTGRLSVPVAGVAVLSVLSIALATGAQAASEPVPLGTATSFAVLAHTGVSNAGPTTITGDLGSSVGAITGLDSITLNGTNHADDAVTQQAQTDLVDAYNQAAGQLPVQPVAVQLGGGPPLTPGVYSSKGALGLTGTLTLDAKGDPNAVFVFQTPSTLITETDSVVSLVGGAKACNVYWQVGSSATVGVRSQFVGTIMALATITVNTEATIQGRLLAQTGAVTLLSNTITQSSCAATPTPTASPTASPTATPTASATAVPQVRNVPRGGVATGDGSTIPDAAGGGLALPVALLGGGALLVGMVTAGVRSRRVRPTR